uniref:Uncharacterized protein n=1 Tax=Arundo donax TaxID=35708 RepID=A0A0A8YN12_ARUDO
MHICCLLFVRSSMCSYVSQHCIWLCALHC